MQKKYVLLFPGQGSQSVGMGNDLCSEFQEMKSTFEEASDTLGFNMSRLCFEDPEGKLNLTEFTQPAILTLSTAIFRTLNAHMQLDFELVAGHSLGEYSALVSIGALKFADALKSVHFRGQAMQRAVPVGVGAMAAYLGNKCDEIPSICKEISTQNNVVEVVNFNSSGQLVLSGNKLAVEQACSVIAEKKLGKAKTLPVSAPFHSSLMKPAAVEMSKFLQNIPLQSFDKKIVANVDAKTHTSTTYTKEILVKQIASPVLWTQTLTNIYSQNSETVWIEVGPGKVLKGLANKTVESANCLTTNDFTAVKELLN
ncbi:MAG: ACP S-malonyltransferase [Bdellovibrionota bacterium]